MSEYTTTVGKEMEIEEHFKNCEGTYIDQHDFAAWLAQHDAEVAEETLNTTIMLLNSELEETEPHPEEARGLTRALQIVSLLATRQGPRDET